VVVIPADAGQAGSIVGVNEFTEP